MSQWAAAGDKHGPSASHSPSLLSAPLHPPRFSLSPKEQVGVREGLG